MKYLCILVAALALFAGCGNSNDPEVAADHFLTAFQERKFDEARKYATPETGKLIDLMENLTKLSGSVDSIVPGTVEIIDHTIDGDKAIVTFKESGSGETQKIGLRHENGKWLVHVTKEDIANKDMAGGAGGNEEGVMMETDSTDDGEDAPDNP